MTYRHSYHAGNFADTVKQLVLVELLRALGRKPAPFFYLETHAGSGAYAINSPETQTGGEFRSGIGLLLEARTQLAGTLRQYVELVVRLGTDSASGRLQRYPGSPYLAAALLRPTDRAVVFEIEAAEARVLASLLHEHRNVSIRVENGYAALRALLPPRERRGLVFIDPPYEQQEAEFDAVLTALGDARERWPSGMYAIWYPIKRRTPVQAFHSRLKATGIRKILCAELGIYPDDSRVGLNSCGMVIVNPPYQLDRTLAEALPALHAALGGRSGTRAGCFWLVPE